MQGNAEVDAEGFSDSNFETGISHLNEAAPSLNDDISTKQGREATPSKSGFPGWKITIIPSAGTKSQGNSEADAEGFSDRNFDIFGYSHSSSRV